MNDVLTVELTSRQCELLLRGLRFVRSSRMLEFRDSSEITEDERRIELGEVRRLAEMLGQGSGQAAHASA